MTAHESLNRVRNGAIAYERLLDKIAYLEALSQRVTPVMSGMPKGSLKQGHTDEPWAALADYKLQFETQINQYLKDCKDLERELGCIKSVRVQMAMIYRYIDRYTIPRIADAMSMNERNVYRLLKKGKQIYEYHFDKGEF